MTLEWFGGVRACARTSETVHCALGVAGLSGTGHWNLKPYVSSPWTLHAGHTGVGSRSDKMIAKKTWCRHLQSEHLHKRMPWTCVITGLQTQSLCPDCHGERRLCWEVFPGVENSTSWSVKPTCLNGLKVRLALKEAVCFVFCSRNVTLQPGPPTPCFLFWTEPWLEIRKFPLLAYQEPWKAAVCWMFSISQVPSACPGMTQRRHPAQYLWKKYFFFFKKWLKVK